MIGAILRTIATLASQSGARALGATVARSAVRGAAQRTLAQAGRSMLGRGFQVLENSTLGSAREMTAALAGQGQAAADAALEAKVMGTQPAAPGFLDRLTERWDKVRQSARQARYNMTPIEDQTKGLTMEQRAQRLQESGRMLPTGPVAMQTGTPAPSLEQIVSASEQAEEKARQEAQQAKEQQGGGLGGKLLKGLILGPTTIFFPVEEALRHFAERIADSNRGLVKFNAQIAESFARRDVGELRAQFKLAQATSGSATMLNDQLATLIEDIQPFRNALGTMLNLLGTGMALGARGLAMLMKMHPVIALGVDLAEKIENNTKKTRDAEMQAQTKDFLRDIQSGLYAQPASVKPSVGRGRLPT
jgi:hypothetical protein